MGEQVLGSGNKSAPSGLAACTNSGTGIAGMIVVFTDGSHRRSLKYARHYFPGNLCSQASCNQISSQKNILN
jgi:hypothetical protein